MDQLVKHVATGCAVRSSLLRCERDFLHPFRPTLPCTQRPVQRILGLLPGLKRLVLGTDHPSRLMARLRKKGRAADRLLFPVCVAMAFYRVNFTFCLYINYQFGRGLRNTTWPAAGSTHQEIFWLWDSTARHWVSVSRLVKECNAFGDSRADNSVARCRIRKKEVPSYTKLPSIVMRLWVLVFAISDVARP